MTKDDLKAYQIAKKKYIDTKERLAEFEMTIYYPSSPKYDGMPKSHADYDQILAAVTDRHDELISLNNAALLMYIAAGRMLDEIESRLSETEAQIVEKRYRLQLPWEVIAEQMSYTERRTLGIHRVILEKISTIPKDFTQFH